MEAEVAILTPEEAAGEADRTRPAPPTPPGTPDADAGASAKKLD